MDRTVDQSIDRSIGCPHLPGTKHAQMLSLLFNLLAFWHTNKNQNSEGLRHLDLESIEFDFEKIPNSTFCAQCMCTDYAQCTDVGSLCTIVIVRVVALREWPINFPRHVKCIEEGSFHA